MSVIGDKFGAYAGKVTSSTVTEAGPAVNVEADAGDLGTILYTTTFGAAVNAAGETGPCTVRGMIFGPDGTTVSVSGGGTWRTIGVHKWELKVINLGSDGQRVLVVEELDLATRSTKGTAYALD